MLITRIMFVFIVGLCPLKASTLMQAQDNQATRTIEDFLNDPVAAFERLKAINDLCQEMMAYEIGSSHPGYKHESYLDKLFARHFREIDDKKMEIVIYLFLNLKHCNGFIWNKTTEAFALRPNVFAKTLESIPEWKSIIEDISLDWPSFSAGLNGLGSTEFERTVKEYATSLHQERSQIEKDIEAFFKDPVGCFDRIKNLDDICLWMGRFMSRLQKEFIIAPIDALFDGPFEAIDEQKVRIMIHLVLHCGPGGQGEVLADRVARVFRAQPRLFARVLEESPEWKRVVDVVSGLGWSDFSVGLEGLGNSKFEKELKGYVASRLKR
jgi:hypothetical protein